ncbi:MAG: hypothetical protein ACRDP1_16470 [Nocardioidaceae bacterium]
MTRLVRELITASISGAVTVVAQRLLTMRLGASPALRRTNYAGDLVTLLEGPAVVAGLAAGALLAPRATSTTRLVSAGTIAAVGGIGGYDDVRGQTVRKGLTGHLSALSHGELTSGAVKLVAFSATGVLAAAALGSGRPGPDPHHPAGLAAVADGALVAGAANLVNLLDLRPGRALKASALAALLVVPTGAGALAAPVLGATAAAAQSDLGARSMLGDCGANALGAALGVSIVAGAPPWVRRGVLGVVVALTMASERVSFSTVIDANPVLSRIDRWGVTASSGESLIGWNPVGR